MLHTVRELKDSVGRQLGNLPIDKIEGVEETLEKAAAAVLLNAGIQEATAAEPLTLYDGVTDYPIDQSIFGTSIVDLRPRGNSRTRLDKPSKVGPQRFDLDKRYKSLQAKVTVEYSNGAPIARISSSAPSARNVLDTMASTTGWTAAGTASSLALDDADFYDDPASLRFALAGSGAGTLTKAIASRNISQFEDLGVAFLAVEIPDTTKLTSITLKVGSSSANYNNVTATAGILGAWASGDWLLVPFDFSAAGQTGTPNWSAIAYAQVTVNHTGAMTNFRVGSLFMSRPSPHELLYQTAAIWKAVGSDPAQRIVGDSDEILLSEAAYLLLEDEAALQMAKDQGGDIAEPKVDTLQRKLYGQGNDPGSYRKYRAQNPSERLKRVSSQGSTARRIARKFNLG